MTTTFDWTDVAESWDGARAHVEGMKAELTEQLIAGLDLAAGDRVLELGAGTGELAVRLADAVGPSGRVQATDAAAGMVALIRRTTAGRPEITTDVVDATDTGLPDASYDAVAFRMGLMLCEEPHRALAECRRVLRPGGRLAVAVWAGMEHNPWLTSLGMAAMMHGAVTGGPPIGPGGVFSLGDPGALATMAREAGFAAVEVREIATPARFASADEHFDTVAGLAGPLQAALAAVPADTLARMRTTAAELIAPHRTLDGYLIPGRALLCLAT